MFKSLIIICVLLLLSFLVYFKFKKPPAIYPLPKTASNVNLKKYAGRWYEIALIPNSFEKGCSCTQATYTVMSNHIKVENVCYKKSKSKYISVTGKAWPVNEDNSKLKVQFFWPFKGDYWILYVDSHYKYALVGGPSSKYLWVLSRSVDMPKKEYDKLISIAEKQGFNIDKLVKTIHDC